ncbi:MAG TPA: 16S rRNA (adenine(1518)-N(6)/adenine(1519)-N(6))-dimethyltransferase RsmA [Candidatus Paceibacterota bacterium]
MDNFNNNFSAKKSLGQNFIHSPNVISTMAHAAKIKMEDKILEVGPGKGALTKKLLETGAHVTVVEKDDRAISFLYEKFAEEIKNRQLEIVHADILEYDETKYEKGYLLIANIPYYITGEFLRKFLESANQPSRMALMLQREVAKRIVDTKESILSISVKVYGTPKYILSVPRKHFRPMPNVDSAILLIENINKNFFINSGISEKYFFGIIKTAFAHKRKVVISNLEEKIARNDLENLWEREKWSRNARAENMTLAMWKKIVGDKPLS